MKTHIRARSTIRNRSFVSRFIALSIVQYTLTVRAFYGLIFSLFSKKEEVMTQFKRYS